MTMMFNIKVVINPFKMNLKNLCKSEIMAKKKLIARADPTVPYSGSMVWPDSVLILDPRWGCVIDGPPGADAANQPQNIDGWFQNELRRPEVRDNNNYARIDLMCRILRYRFNCLFFGPVAKYPNTYTAYDAYNATWASILYTEGQSEKVITLVSKCPNLPNSRV